MVWIESTQKTVEEILNSFPGTKYLEVPLYQRDYSWEKKNWEEFYDDFIRSYKRKKPTDYWGNILIYDNGEGYEIVDGQQRIITIIIFIHSLGKIINFKGRVPLKFKSPESNRVWESLFNVDENGVPIESHSLRKNNFYRAFNFFRDKLKDETTNMKTRYFNFLQKTQFSVVASQDELESYLLFGRLNTRGVHLTDIDLIKYQIFQKTEREAGIAGGDITLERWHEIHRRLQYCKMDFKKYLTAWFVVKYNFDPDNIYRDFLEKINESEYAGILLEILNTSKNIFELIEDSTGSQNRIKRNLEYLIQLSNSTKIYNMIIAIADTAFDSRIRLFEILSVYEFVRAITPPPDIPSLRVEGWTRPGLSHTYEDVDEAYSNFSKNMANLPLKSISIQIRTEILILKDRLFRSLPSKDDFIDLFSNLRYANANVFFDRKHKEKLYSRYAIYTLNNWLEIKTPTPGEDYKVYDDPNYSIEHIVEKSSGNDSNSYQFKIGNLVVLEESINNKLSGENCLPKKFNEYQNSKYAQVKELLNKDKRHFEDHKREQDGIEWNIESFSEEDVSSRGKYLATCFYEQIKTLLS